MNRHLLDNIFYGDELGKLEKGSRWLDYTLARSRSLFGGAAPKVNLAESEAAVRDFFGVYYQGVFDGPITPGDGMFIRTFMEAVRPNTMIEIGVASGISSAFIMSSARQIGLLGEGIFLHSFDILKSRGEGLDIGQIVRSNFSNLENFWRLNTEVTSLGLFEDTQKYLPPLSGPCMAFVDGGHEHPWPALDIAVLSQILPAGSWILLQDTQVMERWIADCIIYGVAAQRPCRGVNISLAHWPGSKIIGHDMGYNMAAIKLDISNSEVKSFIHSTFRYPYEDFNFSNNDSITKIIDSLGD